MKILEKRFKSVIYVSINTSNNRETIFLDFLDHIRLKYDLVLKTSENLYSEIFNKVHYVYYLPLNLNITFI
jgi:hypothetical protein